MNDMSEIDTLSEPTLRRALRLDADEQAPRLDASAIVAAAGRRSRREQLVRLTRGLALVGISLGIFTTLAAAALPAVLDVDPSGLLGFGLAAFAGAAERLVPLASAATDPAVATATLAGLIFATIYERGVGREPARVRAS